MYIKNFTLNINRVLSAVDNENFLNVPGVAILPLGIILQANLLDKIINLKNLLI